MLFIALLIVTPLGLVLVERKLAPGRVSGAYRRADQAVRFATGTYRLQDVMSRMFDEMTASVLPSVKRWYVPNEMVFGLHPKDAARWGGYFAQMADELRDLLLAHVQDSSKLHLGSAGLTVRIGMTEAARPGCPRFAAKLSAAQRPPEPTHVHDRLTIAKPAPKPAPKPATALKPATATDVTRASVQGLRTVADAAASPHCWWLELDGARRVEIVRSLIVGRDPGLDARIDDPKVSRRHARLEYTGHGLRVTDLDSANGTFVNGRRITAPTVVAPGDELRFASSSAAYARRSARRTAECGATSAAENAA